MQHKALEINANPHQKLQRWRMGVSAADALTILLL